MRRLSAIAVTFAIAACAAPPVAAVPPALTLPDVAPTDSPPASASTGGVTLAQGVVATMRDGTQLVADVYQPEGDGPFPVLLIRTPYDRLRDAPAAIDAARRRYIVVVQDVRGRHASKGEWTPFEHESADGYDTVEWAAALRGSNGKVGMMGSSYGGATQLLAAVARPPHLAAIAPDATASDYHDGWVYQGGALELGFVATWTRFLALDTLDRRLASGNALDSDKRLPLSRLTALETGTSGDLAPYVREWLTHPTDDAFWQGISIEPRYGAIRIPVLHSGGWYDVFLRGTLRGYAGLKAHGGQRLVIGPHDHMWSRGEVDFGAEADHGPDTLGWFDAVLRGAPAHEEKPVQLFVMGANVWRGEDDWPLPRARETRYRLRANGVLSTVEPRDDAPDSFVYDPGNPVPTRGGGTCCDAEHFPGGAFDQRTIEARPDVLVYATPAMTAAMEVTGPVSVELFVSSTARDTDFTAKLVDIWPNGFVQNLTDGIVRMRYRASREAMFLSPGQVYPARIDLAGTSNVFLPGHKLALEISSSNFPRFDRNLNTAASPERGSAWQKATNTVFHDRAHPSSLVVQVVPS